MIFMKKMFLRTNISIYYNCLILYNIYNISFMIQFDYE